MKIQMLNKFIGIEQTKKGKKDGLFHIPESSNSAGIIRYVGADYEGSLKVGSLVYFGEKRSQIVIEGSDIQVMEPENIIALVEESDEEKDSKEDDSSK